MSSPLLSPLSLPRSRVVARVVSCSSLAWMGLAIVAFSGCDQKLDVPQTGPLTMEVQVLEGELGSSEDPLPTREGDAWPERAYHVKVTARNNDGSVDTTLNRAVHVRTMPGNLLTDEWVTFNAGLAETDVTTTRLFGETRIWFEDIGQDDIPGSYATGVTDAIHVEDPTISDVQFVPANETCLSPNSQVLDAYECNALNNNYVHIRSDSRLLVVTAITVDGFFVSDCTDGRSSGDPCASIGGNYNSMFVFNHSSPRGLAAGYVLSQLSGGVAEYYGMTQLAFPNWTVEDGLQPPPPEPQLLPESLYCGDGSGMGREPYESDLIRLDHLIIKDFKNDSKALNSYIQYGQWPAVFADTASSSHPCTVDVVSRDTIPNFDPLAHPNEPLDFVAGNFSSYASEYSDSFEWIVLTRGPDDLSCNGGPCQ